MRVYSKFSWWPVTFPNLLLCQWLAEWGYSASVTALWCTNPVFAVYKQIEHLEKSWNLSLSVTKCTFSSSSAFCTDERTLKSWPLCLLLTTRPWKPTANKTYSRKTIRKHVSPNALRQAFVQTAWAKSCYGRTHSDFTHWLKNQLNPQLPGLAITHSDLKS